MYFEKLLEKSGKPNIKALFPNFKMFVYGGVNYQPYRSKLEELMGGQTPTLETYPASEGFIAFQDEPGNPGLLLNVASGIYFEFIPADEIFNENPSRLNIEQIELGVNYAIILNTNAGLWGYNIGDTVEFVSKSPYRIRVTGRIKHFISAFGEHVIGKEVDQAMHETASRFNTNIVEYTVAPQISPPNGELPCHEWFVEFDELPKDINAFADRLDHNLQNQNSYYKDLIDGKVLQRLIIRPLKRDAFRNYMKSIGKLGGQNKVPRLANDRKIADRLALCQV